MPITLASDIREIAKRFQDRIAAYPIEVVEDVLREQIKRDMAEMRRQYPELFREIKL
jgi:hypothetical protein